MDDTDYLAALERERDDYARTGRKDRAEAVAAEIARVRGEVPGKQTRPRAAGAATRKATA